MVAKTKNRIKSICCWIVAAAILHGYAYWFYYGAAVRWYYIPAFFVGMPVVFTWLCFKSLELWDNDW